MDTNRSCVFTQSNDVIVQCKKKKKDPTEIPCSVCAKACCEWAMGMGFCSRNCLIEYNSRGAQRRPAFFEAF